MVRAQGKKGHIHFRVLTQVWAKQNTLSCYLFLYLYFYFYFAT